MKSINQCLNPQLSNLYSKIIQLKQLTTTMNQFLPNTLKNHCHITSFINGRMSIALNEVALATELRYFLPDLRDRLRKQANLFQLTSIDVCIIKHELIPIKTSHTIRQIPITAYSAIISTSEHTKYLPLKNALEKLANRISNK